MLRDSRISPVWGSSVIFGNYSPLMEPLMEEVGWGGERRRTEQSGRRSSHFWEPMRPSAASPLTAPIEGVGPFAMCESPSPPVGGGKGGVYSSARPGIRAEPPSQSGGRRRQRLAARGHPFPGSRLGAADLTRRNRGRIRRGADAAAARRPRGPACSSNASRRHPE
jgi:hypothetical protein